jgi:TDG/mug DNA glycosylase family protein
MDILPDLLHPGLKLVICGSAAGLKSAQLGAYYAGPGNQFWPMLFRIGITPAILTPADFPRLIDYRVGLTDMAKRAYGADSRLVATDFDPDRLRGLILAHQPKILAFNGKRAAAAYFGGTVQYGYQAGAEIGLTRLYVAPSTSGAARRFWDEDIWRRIGQAACADM